MRALVVWLVAVSGVAAADTTPLSALATKPRAGVADGSETKWPCAMNTSELRDAAWHLGDDTLVHDDPSPPAMVDSKDAADIGHERIVVGTRGAELQRARDGKLGRIPLHVVAHLADGLDVYAYRARSLDAEQPVPAVFVLAAFPEGEANLDSTMVDLGASNFRSFTCGIGATLVRVVDGNSRLAELRGSLPDGRRFVVQASVTKTSRNREPILSVVAREVGDTAVGR